MHYSGLEVETQVEINNQVVIDFEEVIATNDVGGNRRTKGLTLERFIVENFSHMLNNKKKRRLFVTDMAASWKLALKHIDDDENDGSADGSDTSSYGSDIAFDKKCIPECCVIENVHDDVYVEHNRSKDFINPSFTSSLYQEREFNHWQSPHGH
ncbi:uncharacterized protein B0J16DRAFT_386838 [Fusarium flagelliforme]|uniref:uncharacterized protein n=1 Tax=Fusarium flagelliforme TaxID=2675880 RepID=UPI001E8D7815|nr:uncharacterized protein B0J16DRAFT_386838 [Fusarium flagelliforme]KAH7179015.1 hypothetical protein B0J16DRAFT_386838 [Fusarium flagelliforme]